ncbi:MAG TPA: alanine racemase [Pseudomonadales bacterium]|nr:alanine racemase [Pseudomonadales bacterium]
MHRLVRAEIDLGAFRHNLDLARRLAGDGAVWPVVKGDAYGHGMAAIAAAVEPAAGFCVADLDEALALREAGVRAPVLVLQGVFDAAGLHAAIAADLVLGVHDPEQVALLEREASRLRASPIGLWLKVDTGMHRLGVAADGAAAFRARLVELVGDARVGTMMHFACADEPGHPLNDRQVRAFAALDTGRGAVSACNSAALVTDLWPADSVSRPGIMLYGASPLPERSAAELDLRPVMTLRSRLIAVKDIAAGETVGYGAAFTAPDAMRIGLVAVGYGDGYPRHAPTGTPVLVEGVEVRTVGRVSMDSIALDLAAAPDARVGDGVTLWGEGLPVERVATAAGTIAYELLTRMPPRVPRVLVRHARG